MARNRSNRLRLLARRGVALLSADAAERITSFVLARHNRDGGFADRGGASDLYYTLFGLDCLSALGHSPVRERTELFLDSFTDGADLDLVHLSCLLRSLARLDGRSPRASSLLETVDRFRGPRGGWRLTRDAPHDSVYATFLAALCHDECGRDMDETFTFSSGLEDLRAADGGFADRPGVRHGTTTVTAAAAVLLASLDPPAADDLGRWLLDRQSPEGGFLASTHAPLPDLLSTASALFALDTLGQSLNGRSDEALGFVADQWLECGGFGGHALDDTADCEYTYYGLLSLGVLGGEA